MIIADTLREARRRIEEPEKWGKGFGRYPKICMLDAIRETEPDINIRGKAYRLLDKAIGICGDFTAWNDAPERTHAEVLRAFDKAIELAEKAE